MAVLLEFIDFIVPISVIEEKHPGGWAWCRKRYEGAAWYDDHLFRLGAMSPDGIKHLVDQWIALGFEPKGDRNGQEYWKDCCVVEPMFGGKTLPCDWLEISEDGRSAYLKGTEPEEVVSNYK